MAPQSPTAHGQGLSGAVKLVVRSFLEQRHYRELHGFLSDHWKECHSLDAVVRLMRSHGVVVSQEEQERFSRMGEEKMIEALVQRMPSQSREQFEHFFLQLSLLTSTTARLRDALMQAKPEVMEAVLDEADKVGVTPYIIKMAIVQAGQEVREQKTGHKRWIQETDATMGPLLRSQNEAMATYRKLHQSQAELNGARASANDKSKKVLMSLSSGNGVALMGSCFQSWAEIMRNMRQENEIRKEYEERIFYAENKLIDYKETQLTNVRGVLNRKAATGDLELVGLCFKTMVEDLAEVKSDRDATQQVRDLEFQLNTYAKEQMENTKKVVARMNADSEGGLIGMVWAAFCQHHKDYAKDKELEEAVKAAEQKVAAMKQNQKEGATSVLQRMSGSSEAGLLSNILGEWIKSFKERKEGDNMRELLENAQGKFQSFQDRNKQGAGSAMNRAVDVQNQCVMIPIFGSWKFYERVEKAKRQGEERYKWRKGQLNTVKGLFQGFANELENTLKSPDPQPMWKQDSRNGTARSGNPDKIV